MANYTISNVKSDLQGVLKGTTTTKITNLNSLFRRAARSLLNDVDLKETIRIAPFTLYDNIYEYSAPTDLKANKLLDIRPQVSRVISDNIGQRYTKRFDQYKKISNNEYAIEFDDTVKTVRINKATTQGITLDDVNGVTANGEYSGGDDATNLTQDSNNYVSGGSSLNFDVDGSGTTAYVENSTLTAVDLSDHDDISSLFVNVYLPSASAITSIELRWGSSSTAYWSASVTQQHYGDFENGWNLLRFDWDGATQTGSPDNENVDYLRVTITYDGTADTDFRLDKIISNIGEIWEKVYYSNKLFRDSSGNWAVEPDTDSDLVNLEEDSYNMYFFKLAEFACQQVKILNNDVAYFRGLYENEKRDYLSRYPSEYNKPQNIYYQI